MAMHEMLSQFDEEQDEWPSYMEWLDHYFLANDIEDAGKKRSILLTACGTKTYKLVRCLAILRMPAELSYNEIVLLVYDHFNPKLSIIVQHFTFNTRVRQTGESVTTYIAELRRLRQSVLVIRCAEPAKNGEAVPFMSGRAHSKNVFVTLTYYLSFEMRHDSRCSVTFYTQNPYTHQWLQSYRLPCYYSGNRVMWYVHVDKYTLPLI